MTSNNNLTHKQKKTLARKMRTKLEAKPRTSTHTGLFDSKAWTDRKKSIQARVKRTEKARSL